jgi:hypothetical protein
MILIPSLVLKDTGKTIRHVAILNMVLNTESNRAEQFAGSFRAHFVSIIFLKNNTISSQVKDIGLL